MPTPETAAAFALASLALLLIPGPAVTYIVMRSVEQGRRAGLVSVLGIGVGTSLHVVAATLGLSALLMSSALAFEVVKVIGAAYLVLIGLRTLLSRGEEDPIGLRPHRRMRRIFLHGVAVNALNPKVALFFLAFLPQFVQPSHGSAAFQILTLGAIFVLLGLVTDGSYAFFASGAGERLRSSATFVRLRRRAAGVVYILLGASAALSGSRSEG